MFLRKALSLACIGRPFARPALFGSAQHGICSEIGRWEGWHLALGQSAPLHVGSAFPTIERLGKAPCAYPKIQDKKSEPKNSHRSKDPGSAMWMAMGRPTQPQSARKVLLFQRRPMAEHVEPWVMGKPLASCPIDSVRKGNPSGK